MDDLFTVRLRDKTGGTIECRGELDICALPALQEALCAALCRGVRTLSVEMAGVSYIDSACIKALLAARSALKERGACLTLLAPSPVVCRTLRLLALDRHLGVSGEAGHEAAARS